jgi:hypothetical protein
MTTVMTLPVAGDAPALEAQLEFHLHAGAAAIVVGDDGIGERSREALERFLRDGTVRQAELLDMAQVAAAELGADWIIPLQPYEFWWPRGAGYGDILARIPDEFDVVLALVRPFLGVGSHSSDVFLPGVHRLSAQAYANEPGGVVGPHRRLAHRRGVDVGAYAGEVVASALRPLRGWYPIEVLWFPPSATEQEVEIEAGLRSGVVQLDTRLSDFLEGLRAGERPEFPRPSVIDNAQYAADAAVLGEADAFRLLRDMDALERRIAGLEDTALVRMDRKVRSLIRRGDTAT